MTIPYVRSTVKATVVKADDTIIELFDTYLQLRVNATEEVPVDEEDEYLGVREVLKFGFATILKSSIGAIEMGWDSKAECYDFSIFTNTTTWAYNCKSKELAQEYYTELINWLLK